MDSSADGLQQVAPWYRRKWVRIVGIMLAALSIVVALGVVVLAVQWNSRPEKVMFEAIDYALKQPGSYHMTSDTIDIKLAVDGRQYAVDATVDSVPLKAVVNADVLFIKTPQPEQLVEKIVPASQLASLKPVIGGIVSESKDKWLQINLKNKALDFPVFDQLGCALKAKSVMSSSDDARRSVTTTYLKHPFLVFQTTESSDTSVTYNMTLDDKKREEFREALWKTDVKQSVSECVETPIPVLENLDVTALTMEIAKPIHKFQKLTLMAGDKNVGVVTTDYSKKPVITIPEDATNLDQVVGSVFTTIMQSYFRGR